MNEGLFKRTTQLLSGRTFDLALVCSLVATLWITTQFEQYDPSSYSATYPQIILGVTLGALFILFATAKTPDRLGSSSLLLPTTLVVLACVYLIALEYLHYSLATALFIPPVAMLCGYRKLGIIAIAAGLFVGLSLFVFTQLLHLQLPGQ